MTGWVVEGDGKLSLSLYSAQAGLRSDSRDLWLSQASLGVVRWQVAEEFAGDKQKRAGRYPLRTQDGTGEQQMAKFGVLSIRTLWWWPQDALNTS